MYISTSPSSEVENFQRQTCYHLSHSGEPLIELKVGALLPLSRKHFLIPHLNEIGLRWRREVEDKFLLEDIKTRALFFVIRDLDRDKKIVIFSDGF